MLTEGTSGATPAQRIRAEAKEATRRALLEAGLALTMERGGVLPSIEAISARAGFTRGAFYVHFKNRTDFIVQLLDRVTRDIFRVIFQDAADGAADLRGIVTRFTRAMVDKAWPDVADIRSAYLSVIAGLRESDRVRTRHADLMRAAGARLEAAILEGQRAGTVQADMDAAGLARIILLIAIGLIVWDDIGMPLDPVPLGEQFLALLGDPTAG